MVELVRFSTHEDVANSWIDLSQRAKVQRCKGAKAKGVVVSVCGFNVSNRRDRVIYFALYLR